MSIPFNSEIAESHKFPVTSNNPDNSDPDWLTYEQFVCALVAPMTDKDNIHHMATGISGEGGELLDCSKKTWVYGKPLDRENMIEELGDLEWYMAGLRQMLGISRHEVLAANIRKLEKRYKDGTYSDAAAIERADKKPEVIDVTSAEYKVANPPISQDVVDAVDEQALVIQEWCVPLLQAYHTGKTVRAIAYSRHTATVLFEGDDAPYKLYKPQGEQ